MFVAERSLTFSFTHSKRNATEEFDLSHVQVETHRRAKHSDLLWIIDSCWASFKAWADRYPSSEPSRQRETLSGCKRTFPIRSDVGFSRRFGQNLLDRQDALSVRERFQMVSDPGDVSENARYRMESGKGMNSIVLAPLRGSDEKVVQLEPLDGVSLLGINEKTVLPFQGTWDEWRERGPDPRLLREGWRDGVDDWTWDVDESAEEKEGGYETPEEPSDDDSEDDEGEYAYTDYESEDEFPDEESDDEAAENGDDAE